MTLPAGVGSASARWLFSEHFLAERVPAWPEFAGLDVAEFHRELQTLWESERASLVADANEGLTEERFIRPALALLGGMTSLTHPG